jgi:K+-sensing histidine kinase KdpD
MMHADQMRLRQALLNLMSNANKFTEKGTVTIAAHQGQENGRDWIKVSVRSGHWRFLTPRRHRNRKVGTSAAP